MPPTGLKLPPRSTLEIGHRQRWRPTTPATTATALARLARFKQLCTPEELQIKISKDECSIEPVWQHAQEETPPLLTDAAFASFVELGRRGTGHPVNPKRVELKRKAETTRVHEGLFQMPGQIRSTPEYPRPPHGRPRPAVPHHNAELLEMLDPQLDKALKEQRAQRSIGEQVKWILKRLLAGARPDVSAVARELGLSDRTLPEADRRRRDDFS